MSRDEVRDLVMQASGEQETREVYLGTNYAGQGRKISAVIWVVTAFAALGLVACLWYVSSYGPLGKGFAGMTVLWLSIRIYSQITQNRGY
ncbi:MAG: hypothetical protein KC800_14900 [Candidatus Eremiobacteraeota bacterium]|nr:hypothetical protein [Candidatus Eremiobacteraeota bacterium]